MKVKSIKIILEVTCACCGHVNYIRKGNYDECTVSSDDGMVCWFCQDKEWFAEDLQTLNEVDIWFQPGAKRP